MSLFINWLIVKSVILFTHMADGLHDNIITFYLGGGFHSFPLWVNICPSLKALGHSVDICDLHVFGWLSLIRSYHVLFSTCFSRSAFSAVTLSKISTLLRLQNVLKFFFKKSLILENLVSPYTQGLRLPDLKRFNKWYEKTILSKILNIKLDN